MSYKCSTLNDHRLLVYIYDVIQWNDTDEVVQEVDTLRYIIPKDSYHPTILTNSSKFDQYPVITYYHSHRTPT